MKNTQEHEMVPIKEGLFTLPLTPLSQVRMAGSKCGDCGEVALGKRSNCPNCGRKKMEDLPLSNRGTLWTYTVIRHKPPGDYKGPDPFVPFGLGLVDLPEGIRVLAPIDCNIDKLAIGMKLQLEVFPLYKNEAGSGVLAFKFRPV